jgi:hypothetical protein
LSLEEPRRRRAIIDPHWYWHSQCGANDTPRSISAVVPGDVGDPVAHGEVRHLPTNGLDFTRSPEPRNTGKVEGSIGTGTNIDVTDIDGGCVLANE